MGVLNDVDHDYGRVFAKQLIDWSEIVNYRFLSSLVRLSWKITHSGFRWHWLQNLALSWLPIGQINQYCSIIDVYIIDFREAESQSQRLITNIAESSKMVSQQGDFNRRITNLWRWIRLRKEPLPLQKSYCMGSKQIPLPPAPPPSTTSHYDLFPPSPLSYWSYSCQPWTMSAWKIIKAASQKLLQRTVGTMETTQCRVRSKKI